MAINEKRYGYYKYSADVRPVCVSGRLDVASKQFVCRIFTLVPLYFMPMTRNFADFILVANLLYFWWPRRRPRVLPFKMPMDSKFKDMNNTGAGRSGKPKRDLSWEQCAPTTRAKKYGSPIRSARTHILYLGTTGAGKTEGLKSIVSNALTWGSGFVYIDGKADTDLWSSLSSLVRRFGRDDDLLVLNYMTGKP